MTEISNAQHLREWLFECRAIDPGKRFDVDWLGDEPTEYALITVPSALRWRENVLGERRLLDAQEQSFIFALQGPFGADAEGNLKNLALCQAVMNWIIDRNARGDFPRWEGGVVTAVTPTLSAAPVAQSAGTARYQIQIRVLWSGASQDDTMTRQEESING